MITDKPRKAYWDWKDMDFKEIEGMTFTAVEALDGGEIVRFTRDNGDVFEQYHSQDCCENVNVEDIVGDLSDLVGTPILVAEERSQEDPDHSWGVGEWTFYEARTIKGSVTIRWYGSSNGYYSTSVNFAKVN